MSPANPPVLPPYAAALGYGGLIPFVACALATMVLPDPDSRVLAGRVLLAYGGVILSFLGGVHWGLVVRAPGARAALMLAAGVIPSLVGWLTLLLPLETALAIQVAAFGGFWLYEHRVLGEAAIPPVYLSLRRTLTLVACASLALALMAPSLVPALP